MDSGDGILEDGECFEEFEFDTSGDLLGLVVILEVIVVVVDIVVDIVIDDVVVGVSNLFNSLPWFSIRFIGEVLLISLKSSLFFSCTVTIVA